MQNLIYRFACICLLSIVALTGCASGGSEFLGSWVNTKNQSDTFQVIRNGDEYLIVNQGKKGGATFKDGNLEVGGGALLSVNLTYVKQSDTILTPGFFGQIEYKRKN